MIISTLAAAGCASQAQPLPPHLLPPPPLDIPNPFVKPKPNPEALERLRLFNEKMSPLWQATNRNYLQGKLAEAEQTYLQIIALDEEFYGQKDTGGTNLLGEIYLRGGKNAKARECFLQIFPLGNNGPMFLNLALADCRLGRFEEARHLYFSTVVQRHLVKGLLKFSNLAVESLPDNESDQGMFANIAWACGVDRFMTGYSDEAAENFSAADKLWPKNPIIQFYWGSSLLHSRHAKEAIPHYQFALARCSGDVLKMAKEGAVLARQAVENEERLKAQHAKKQAEQKAQSSGNTAP